MQKLQNPVFLLLNVHKNNELRLLKSLQIEKNHGALAVVEIISVFLVRTFLSFAEIIFQHLNSIINSFVYARIQEGYTKCKYQLARLKTAVEQYACFLFKRKAVA